MPPAPQMITGSYNPEDVTFLLKPVQIIPTDIATKERLIQSGAAHYSEMISQERRPDERYLEIFGAARSNGVDRIAREISGLARRIADRVVAGSLAPQLTLCSLVRAGVPYGVLLQRELSALGVDTHHFGVSIIRDRGLDHNAMAYILDRRTEDGVVFVDGWTGKGAIATELQKSWQAITGRNTVELVVLADPCGFATMSGSHDDWLIPSGILGANVSGLISRSILNPDVIGPDDFHGSIPVDHLNDIDVSLDYVDQITRHMDRYRTTPVPADQPVGANARQARALAAVHAIAKQFEVTNLNRIKPGIAEATRAILRRRPQKVFVRSFDDPDLAALIHLCRTDCVDMIQDQALLGPYRAITLIEKVA
ncbi:cysteine protease StiP domain-containing protein [Puniceibacterium sp. IMCC21224]|uniref:cysteine protease StiP domain-containing protein n=1 Tax=Puniceibacterium sp. IMCC21224 TaxID=1618204 RepID=UPI00064D88EF|nr:cysteine protease StiP domain-containing protein [Puniceibacterium sp. IMCC21224]KMK68672.1 PELOTA RNA binding domain/Phosphoribosyl transferase (PRTase) [Puniceibacterium sp. IMCC21224]